MLDDLQSIEEVCSWVLGKYGLWGSLGIAIAVFAWIFIKWIVANPEKAEKIYGWFRPQSKNWIQATIPGRDFDKARSLLRIARPAPTTAPLHRRP
jgi:hypothetical protein